jgi:hypothetical protein
MIGFDPSSTMSQIIGNAPAFKAFAQKFEDQVKRQIAASHSLCGFDGNRYLAQLRPAYFHDPLYAYTVMGGYQRLEVTVGVINGSISFRYRIYDHFGAGLSDAKSKLPGLPALYYLQHYAGRWGSRYTPFVWWVGIVHNVQPAPGWLSTAPILGGGGGRLPRAE